MKKIIFGIILGLLIGLTAYAFVKQSTPNIDDPRFLSYVINPVEQELQFYWKDKDINKDGKYSDEDKQIVLDLLERKIIKDQGGIGKYPGTNAVHMDVRGYRARWDSY